MSSKVAEFEFVDIDISFDPDSFYSHYFSLLFCCEYPTTSFLIIFNKNIIPNFALFLLNRLQQLAFEKPPVVRTVRFLSFQLDRRLMVLRLRIARLLIRRLLVKRIIRFELRQLQIRSTIIKILEFLLQDFGLFARSAHSGP